MTLDIEKFTKRPIEIEAVQFVGTKTHAESIVDWIMRHGHEAREAYVAVEETVVIDNEDGTAYKTGVVVGSKLEGVSITTLEGEMLAQPNDWIIKGVKGEFYPCKPDVFEASYVKAGTDA